MKKIINKKVYSYYLKHLEDLKQKNQYRQLQLVNKKNIIDFSHNDYLCLSKHPYLLEQAMEYGKKYGVGARASRILSGNLEIHEQLENKIATAKGTESALLFPSGYQANLTILPALFNKKLIKELLVFSDRLNHSSIHSGCFLAEVKQIRYANINMIQLENQLEIYESSCNHKFIITESVFSMDGTQVDMSALTRLAKKYRAFLYIDEAHATGVVGSRGYGLTCEYSNMVDISMGTFSKALGVSGGYIACKQQLKNFLINNCKGFIYSTAIPPVIVGAISAAWDLVPVLQPQRVKLLETANLLRTELQNLGIDTLNSTTHIIPILVKNIEDGIKLREYLYDNNIIVSMVRPPTVPANAIRLRLSLNIEHTSSQIEKFICLLKKWRQENA